MAVDHPTGDDDHPLFGSPAPVDTADDGTEFGHPTDDGHSQYGEAHYDEAHFGEADASYDDTDQRNADHAGSGPSGLDAGGGRRAIKRAEQQRRRRRRRRRLIALLAVAAIVVVVAVGVIFAGDFVDRFKVADYSGTADQTVRIQIQPGDTADDVASTLRKAGVVKSNRAFLNAASASGRSGDIQPGVYVVHLKSSGAAAFAAILDPANRLVDKVTIPEGYTAKQILAVLAAKTGLPLADLQAAANKVDQLSIPGGFSPKSVEGFLYPATYEINPDVNATDLLSELTSSFSSEIAQVNFATDAKALGITQYQALIVASLVESEAKFEADRPKIARVIYNRLAAKQPIGIDASNRYGAVLAGKDPSTLTYTEDSPYNVRVRLGLPPTPVSNPGAASLQAAVQPAAGNWLYYVVSDAAGHHLFTADDKVFNTARLKCIANKWGCS